MVYKEISREAAIAECERSIESVAELLEATLNCDLPTSLKVRAVQGFEDKIKAERERIKLITDLPANKKIYGWVDDS